MSSQLAPAQDGHRLRLAAACGVGVLVVAALFAISQLGLDGVFEQLAGLVEIVKRAPPVVYFSVMAIACVFPIPISAFYVASAPLFGIPTALAWISVALIANICLGHTAASGLLRPTIVRVLESRGHRLPRAGAGSDEILLIVLLRISPGIPFFAQNLMLGLAQVDLLRSLVISVPIQMIWATGFVVLGQSAFDGSLGLALFAVGGIGAASIAARFMHRRMQARIDPETPAE